MTAITSRRYDAICHRLMRGDEIVGLVGQLANDRWIITDLHGKRMTKLSYASVRKAVDDAQLLFPADQIEGEP